MKVKISKLITMALIMFGALFTSCSKDDTVKVFSVKLSQTTVSIQLGEKVSLKATVTPSDAKDAIVTWSTSSASVATVDNSGNVSAVSIGTATITASAGGMTATCTVTVKPKAVTGVTLSESTLTLKTGDKAELKATVVPSDATDGTVTWTSSAATIATVDDKGNVTAVAAGTATITAKAGDMTATCTVTVKERDVYVVGDIYNSKGISVATIWKNGVATSLFNDSNKQSVANDVFVSGGDVYVAGQGPYGSLTAGKIWKNGVETNIYEESSSCSLYSIFVSGNDVYVGGYYRKDLLVTPAIWKNGVRTLLTAPNLTRVTSLYVSGSDVYALGNAGGQSILWKNTVATTLPKDTYKESVVTSIYVSGSDVYVSGYVVETNNVRHAAFWKNNVLTVLDNTSTSTYGNSLYVSDSDVYVAGTVAGKGIVLWKNGVQSFVYNTFSNIDVTSLFIVGGDVYISAIDDNVSVQKSYLFKNGVKTQLSATESRVYAKSVFVY